ncbi:MULTISPECIES: pectate lyase-like adhesive domain-containing protein [Listeria]|uniref:pectate lyase-like adhesive domain-containing protein n=1 Tax=Listeria TaxID=1637 RepID=UPI000B59447A|nr:MULTISPECIES: pectate lyase-like adhesive domain-containing protein [Listeria]
MRKCVFIFFFTLVILGALQSVKVIDSKFSSRDSVSAAITLNADETIVNNYTELKAAVQNNSISKIYFGADISLSSGIQVPVGRTPFTISGKDPTTEEIHTLTETGSSTSTSGTIYISSNSSTKQITMQDLTILGKNYYGTVYVANAAKGVNVTYDNVVYKGPQLIWNTAGTLELVGNTNVEIGKFVSGSASNQEFAEVGGINFGGNIEIYHPSSSSDSLVWYGEDSSTSNFFNVRDGANVNISANGNGVFYRSASNPVSISVGKNATLNLNTTTSFNRSGVGGNFFVDEGGTARIYQSDVSSELLSLSGALTVNKDATVVLNKTGGSGNVIKFNSGGSLNVNDPAYFLLYNGNTSNTIGYASGSGQMNLNGGLINYWDRSGSASTIGLPTYSYSREDQANVQMGITTNGSTTTINSANVPVTAAEFNVAKMKVLSIGNLPLNVNTLNDSQATLSGATVTNAAIEISYVENGTTKTLTGTADNAGNFQVAIPGGFIKPYTEVSVTASTEYYINKTTKITVVDVTPPTGDAVPQIVSIGEALSTNANAFVTNIRDKADNTSGQGVTANIEATPDTSTFGSKKAEVSLTDRAGNQTRIDVPVFVKDADTVVQNGTALKATSFSVDQSEVGGKSAAELGQLIKEKSNALGFDVNSGANISNEITIQSSTLQAVPGDYTATLELRGVTKTVSIHVFVRSVKFEEVSQEMDFKPAQITGKREILERDESTWEISVVDTRNSGSKWVVNATITKPLTSTKNPDRVLENAFIFVGSNGEKIVLGDSPYPVFEYETTNANPVQVDWANNRGVLVEADTTAVYAGDAYQGKISWTLQDAP